jgi:hypothetical protein
MGFQWVGRRRFVDDIVLMHSGTRITIEMFVKFVRHKLGGAHFDADRDGKKNLPSRLGTGESIGTS